METMIATIAAAVAKEGLKEENIEKAIGLIKKHGGKVSSKVSEFMEKVRQNRGQDAGGEIPAEVQEEVLNSLKEILKEHARPVYMGGIAFFCENILGEEPKELLKKILTNIDDEKDGIEWEDGQDIQCQESVDKFMWDFCGRPLYEESDCCIGDDFIYLNLPLDDDEDYYRLYDCGAVRNLADALNHLLGDKYITQFTIY